MSFTFCSQLNATPPPQKKTTNKTKQNKTFHVILILLIHKMGY